MSDYQRSQLCNVVRVDWTSSQCPSIIVRMTKTTLGLVLSTAALAIVALSAASHGDPIGDSRNSQTITVGTTTSHADYPISDFNVIYCNGAECVVQWDPTDNPNDFSGWTGTASTAAVDQILGFNTVF
jgi:hypothetical protein